MREIVPTSRKCILVATLLWSCLSGAAVTAGQAVAAEEKRPAAPVTVNFAFSYGWQAEIDNMKKSMAQFEAANPGIRVSLIPVQYGDWNQKLTTLIATNGVDVVTLSQSQFASLAASDALLDITDRAAHDPTWHPEQMRRIPVQLPIWIDGRRYGFAPGWGTLIMAYNADHFAEAGLIDPNTQYRQGRWTWAGFVETARKLTKVDSNGLGRWGLAGWGAGYDWIAAIYQNGGSFYSIQGGHLTDFTLDSEKSIQALQWVVDLRWKEKVLPPHNDYAKASFEGGTASMCETGAHVFTTYAKSVRFNWDIMPYPKGTSDILYAQPGWGGVIYAIARSTKVPDAAYKLARYFVPDAEAEKQRIAKDGAMGPSLYPELDRWALEHPSPVMPKSMWVMFEVFDKAYFQPIHPLHDAIMTQVNKYLDPVWYASSQPNVREAAIKASEAARAIIRSYKK